MLPAAARQLGMHAVRHALLHAHDMYVRTTKQTNKVVKTVKVKTRDEKQRVALDGS